MEANLEILPIGEDAPETVNVVVEIPAGSRNEYEPELGVIMRDRVLPGNVRYPADEPNIFAVPADDPRFEDIESLEDMPEQNLREIEDFFVTFSQLEGDEEAEVQGWRGLEETYEIIRESTQA
jgi:inorganic pyrophosphatase